MQGMQVPSLVGELRFHMHFGLWPKKQKNIKQKQYCNKFNTDWKTAHIKKKKNLSEIAIVKDLSPNGVYIVVLIYIQSNLQILTCLIPQNISESLRSPLKHAALWPDLVEISGACEKWTSQLGMYKKGGSLFCYILFLSFQFCGSVSWQKHFLVEPVTIKIQ